MRSVGGEERHTIEFGFRYAFSIRAGPKSNGLTPDFWWSSSREGALGEHKSLEEAMRACEGEAKRLIEGEQQDGVIDFDLRSIREQWSAYLASPKRLKSIKTRSRYK